MTESRHADAYDFRLKLTQAREIHPPTAHHARPKIIVTELANERELTSYCNSFRRRHIHRNRAFVAMQIALQSRLPRSRRPRLPLQLNYFRPEIGKNPRRSRACHDPGEIQYPNSLERQRPH